MVVDVVPLYAVAALESLRENVAKKINNTRVCSYSYSLVIILLYYARLWFPEKWSNFININFTTHNSWINLRRSKIFSTFSNTPHLHPFCFCLLEKSKSVPVNGKRIKRVETIEKVMRKTRKIVASTHASDARKASIWRGDKK